MKRLACKVFTLPLLLGYAANSQWLCIATVLCVRVCLWHRRLTHENDFAQVHGRRKSDDAGTSQFTTPNTYTWTNEARSINCNCTRQCEGRKGSKEPLPPPLVSDLHRTPKASLPATRRHLPLQKEGHIKRQSNKRRSAMLLSPSDRDRVCLV